MTDRNLAKEKSGLIPRISGVWTLLLICLAGLFAPQARADDLTLSKQLSANYLCQSWQSEEGLPFSIIRALAQTRDGYLVLGTQEGIIRFDGAEFKMSTEGTINERKDRSYVPLLEMHDGGLWYSDRENGLIRYQNGQITHLGAKDGLTNGYVLCLYEDREQNLWIGAEGGLARWKNNKLESFHGSRAEPLNFIRTILEDHDGRILLGTPEGVKEFKDGGATFMLHPFVKTFVWSILEDKANNLWIGTGDGLLRWSHNELRRFNCGDNPANNTIRSLYQDRAGILWVGAYGGLYQLLDEQLIPLHFDYRMVDELVYAITEDKEGDLWIGSNSGLTRLRSRRFQTYSKEDGLRQDAVSSICGDLTNGIWIATWGAGLSHLENGLITNWSRNNGLISDVIYGLYQSPNGTLWVGTGGGLDMYQNDSSRRFSTNNGLGEKIIKVIFEDSTGKTWLGGEETLSYFDGARFRPYVAPGRSSFDNVNAIAEDPEGNIWVGSNNGLTRIHGPGIYQRFTENDDLGSRVVEALYADPNGTLWIGTDTGGLVWWKEKKFYHCTVSTGLPCEEISQILDDDLGNLWLGSRKGIFRVPKQQLFDLGAKKTNSIVPVSFGRTDGLLSIQCRHLAQPSCYKDKNGKLWFATARGAAVVDPKKLQINTNPPPVILKQVRVDGHPMALDSHPTLSPSLKEVEFFFTALSFQAASKVQFKVKLENFDNDWKDNGPQRRRRYTGLRPGKYTFRVMACNNDNVWNEALQTFSFQVAPKFYETNWFYGFCGLVIFGSGMGLNRIRVKKLKIREKELMATVSERTEFARRLEKEIQERKLAEATVQESQMIILRQERLAAVGQLSAGVAHEFNNILTVILGHASLLHDQIRIPKVNESLAQITISAERAAQLTKQMLAFSRKQVLQPAAVQLNNIVRQEVNMLRQVVEESISLQQTHALSLPLIWADIGMIEQVIMNLSLNARDAMPKGGKLEVQTAELTISSAETNRHPDAYPGSFVLLKVTDTGTGMDKETMQRIFEPFFTTKDVGKGTGLGLSTVYGIVKQHSGWIEVVSKTGPGSGTTFTIFFPVYSHAAKEKAKLAMEGAG